MILRHCFIWLSLVTIAVGASANDAAVELISLKSLEQNFGKQISPIIKTHCVSCHDAETNEAELDLTVFRRLQDVTKSHRVWKTILERVEAGEMPPAEATKKLSDADRHTLTQWIRGVRQVEAKRHCWRSGSRSWLTG